MSRATQKAKREAAENAVVMEHAKGGRDLKDIAPEVGYTTRHLTRIKAEVMERLVDQTKTELQRWQAEHIEELQNLRKQLLDPLIPPADKISLALAIIREDSKIKGTAAPTKSISATVNAGHQLDTLYLEIRQILLPLADDDREDALKLMQEFAAGRKRPVVVDAMPFRKELSE